MTPVVSVGAANVAVMDTTTLTERDREILALERLWWQYSGAKEAEMSRSQVVELFNQGLTFLNALLEGIDETQLR